MRISSDIASRLPGGGAEWYDRSPWRTSLKPLFERGHGRRREAHPSDERVDVAICVRDHRSSHVRTLALEACEERLDESPTNTFVARLRVNAEELHPAGRLLETELATTDLTHRGEYAARAMTTLPEPSRFSRERDLDALVALVGRLRSGGSGSHFLHPGGLQWLLRRTVNPDFAVFVWHEQNELVAFVVHDGDYAMPHADPARVDVTAILAWTEAHARDAGLKELEVP